MPLHQNSQDQDPIVIARISFNLHMHTQQDFRIKLEFPFWCVSFSSSYASIRAGLGFVAGITRAKTDAPKRELS